MNDKLFRKKSIDRVTSPEQLDDYIRVTGPSLWAVLLAVVVLLSAVLVWGVFGSLPTQLSAVGYAEDGVATVFLSPQDAARVETGMSVQTGNSEGVVRSVSEETLSLHELEERMESDYLASELAAGTWNIPVQIDVPEAPDGVVQIRITIDSIRPIQFILN